MYRLVLYFLMLLLAVAAVLGTFHILPYSPLAILYSTGVLLLTSWITNGLFARVFRAHTNKESFYITAFILALIITPVEPASLTGLGFLIWAAVWSMAAKYILAIGKKHVFNPAAFAVALTSLTIAQSATWWVGGNLALLPLVLLGGLLITRKIQRFDLIWSFFGAALITIALFAPQGDIWSNVWSSIVHSPLFFFAFIMLTEPLTTPATRGWRMAYGALTGILFAPFVHVGPLYSTPELALLAGNFFSYLVSPKGKYLLTLKKRVAYGDDTYDFVFQPDKKLRFRPGQYLEWTLGHKPSDGRGNRRYFTLASSPTEAEVHLGVKFYPRGSSYKRRLITLEPGDELVAGQLAGDFVLPKDRRMKLAFIAGGIGITPFRSMAKYMADKNEKRDAILFYSNRLPSEIAYADVFAEANRAGLRTVYTLTDEKSIPADWRGERGRLSADIIKKYAPDFRRRTFFISGTQTMVENFQALLRNMGVRERNIRTDFFPGF